MSTPLRRTTTDVCVISNATSLPRATHCILCVLSHVKIALFLRVTSLKVNVLAVHYLKSMEINVSLN